MALRFPNGAVFGIATSYADPESISDISNANPAVATDSAGTIVEGDVVVINSGWAGIDRRATVIGDDTAGLTLTGIDTTDTKAYPTGGGAGALVVASDFVDFSQEGDVSTSGGDQQYWQGQFLEDPNGRQIQVPTFKNAKTFTLPLYFDPKLPWYDVAKKADRRKEPVVLRLKLPSGDVIFYNGYLSFDGDPSLTMNEPMQNTMTFTPIADPTLVEAE